MSNKFGEFGMRARPGGRSWKAVTSGLNRWTRIDMATACTKHRP